MRHSLVGRVGRILSAATNSVISAVEAEMPEEILLESLRDLYQIDEELAIEIGEQEAYNAIDLRKANDLDAQHKKLSANMTLEGASDQLKRAGIKRQIDIESSLNAINTAIIDRQKHVSTLQVKRAEVAGAKKQIEDKIEQIRTMYNVAEEIENGSGNGKGGVLIRAGRVMEEAEFLGRRFVPTTDVCIEQNDDVDRLLELDADAEVERRLALINRGRSDDATSDDSDVAETLEERPSQ